MVVPAKKSRAQRNATVPRAGSADQPAANLAASAALAGGHVVQFYDDDQFLAEAVAEYVSQGLEAGDACLVVATPAHKEQIEHCLRASGIDLDAACRQGSFAALDPGETMRRLLDGDGMPSVQRFEALVEDRIAALAKTGRHIRVFGEMVALLWASGNQRGAIRLEALWSELQLRIPDLSLYCGYPMSSMVGTEHAALFAEVCAQHTHVLPDETYAADQLGPEERRRAIALLQQRARSLEVEIGRREQVEEQLRASEQRYRLLFETAQDGILLVDPRGRTVADANPATMALLGAAHDAIVGQALWQIGLFPDRIGADAMLEDLEQHGTVRYETLPLHRPDGQVRTVELVGARFVADGGDMIQCTLHDVTERRESERRLAAALTALLAMAEALVAGSPTATDVDALAAIAEDAPPGVTPQPDVATTARRLADLTRSVLHCGKLSIAAFEPETERMHPLTLVGFTVEEERIWWAGWRPETTLTSRMGADVAARLRAGEMVLLDVQAPPHRDRLAPFHVETLLVVPARIGDKLVGGLALHYDDPEQIETEHERVLAGAVAHLVGLVIERERLLLEREEARASALALAAANQRMSEFLSIASHELKTPVTIIKANLQLCSRRLRRSLAYPMTGEQGGAEALLRSLDKARELIDRTEHGADRLVRLVDDLLDASRIQGNKLDLRVEPVELAAIVREAVEEQRHANPPRTIAYSAPAGAISVVADRDRIGQVVTNYLTNALKYSAENQPVTVSVEAYRQGSVARVSVRDQGPGLPPEEHGRVWEMFQRSPQVEVQSGSGVGLGLGLHICKTIVERHGGQVGVESTVGSGSSFWFTLPLASLGE